MKDLNMRDPVAVVLERLKLIFQIIVLGAAFYVIVVGERERVQTSEDVVSILNLAQTIRHEVAQPWPDVLEDADEYVPAPSTDRGPGKQANNVSEKQ